MGFEQRAGGFNPQPTNTAGQTYKLEKLVNVEVLLRVDGRLEQRQKDVTEQLLKAVHHLVLTVYVTEQRADSAASDCIRLQ